MAVSYGPKGAAVAKALGAGKVSAPPFAKGSDGIAPVVALGHIDPKFFKASDFTIDCDGCTACCRGDDGPRINEDEVHDYQCHKDKKGEWRLDQVDGHCVYLDLEDNSCAIHGTSEEWGEGTDPADNLDGPSQPPYVCRAFDCRSLILKFNDRGLDYMVNSKQLPLDVVIQGRAQLKAFNAMLETRASVVGADLSSLMMVPAEEKEKAELALVQQKERDDAPPNDAA